jgi:metalloendopeptidase OMA1, mitochondrial
LVPGKLTFCNLAATMNAFVLPGGKVFVYSGILSVCRNDSGLAAVLGE